MRILTSVQSPDRPEPTYVTLARNTWKGDVLGLFAAGQQVEALLAHPGWPHVARLIDLELAGLDTKMDGRPLESRADYAHLHGRRSGLRSFQQAAHAIVAESARQLAEQQAKHEATAEPVA